VRRGRPATNLEAQKSLAAPRHRLGPDPGLHHPDGPAGGDHHLQVALGPVPLLYLAGGIGGQIAYVAPPPCWPTRTAPPPGGHRPFVFKEWVPNSHFTATANPHYWRPGLPYLDQITFKPIPDEDARAEALKSGTIDIMITDTPQIITQFRGNKDYSYIDDSTTHGRRAGHELPAAQLPGRRRSTTPRPAGRRHGDQPPQYAKEIDEGVLPVSNGLFVPGSPYYSKTAYPNYNPSRGQEAGQAGGEEHGQAGVLHLAPPTRRPPSRAGVPQQAMQEGRLQGEEQYRRAERPHQHALAGTFEALGWRQFGAVDPDLNYIFWSTTTVSSGTLSINMARNADPKIEAALQLGRTSTDAGRARQGLPDGQQAPGHRPALPVARPGRLGGREHAVGAELEQPDGAQRVRRAFGMIGGSIWPTQIWIS
jgi:peptide/nickel transport system substrate-binding protein